MAMLGVQAALLAAHGAVSEPVARAMAEGALTHSDAHMAVAVTGIAGPTGGTEGKPVGLVWFGVAERDGLAAACSRHFPGDRAAVRAATVELALRLVLDRARPGAPAASRLPFRGSSPV
jgi:nicotinamide-nucleotide amidase